MKNRLLILATFFVAALSASAEPVTLSRAEAFELHASLSTLAPGLTPEHTLTIADNINALESVAKGYRQGYSKLLQLQQLTNAAPTPENVAKFREEDQKFAALSEEKKTFDLAPVELTKDEVKAANISASMLATIKRLLKPDTKK